MPRNYNNNIKKKQIVMNKTELINAIVAKAGLSKVDATKALKAGIEAVEEALAKGDKVALIGFGTFAVQEKGCSHGHQPRNQAENRNPCQEGSEVQSWRRAHREGEIKTAPFFHPAVAWQRSRRESVSFKLHKTKHCNLSPFEMSHCSVSLFFSTSNFF